MPRASFPPRQSSCRRFEAQRRLIDEQQYRQASPLQPVDLPADDLRDVKCDGGKECRVRQEWPASMKKIGRQRNRALDLPFNGDGLAEET